MQDVGGGRAEISAADSAGPAPEVAQVIWSGRKSTASTDHPAGAFSSRSLASPERHKVSSADVGPGDRVIRHAQVR